MLYGVNYPATKTTQSVAPESNDNWVTIANIGANDSAYASITAATYDANDISYRAKAQGFGFVIPAGTVIDGIIVQIERRCAAGSAVDYRVQLLDENGNLVGDNKADTVNAWAAVDTMKPYGGTTDLWGWSGVTATKLNNANFGVVVSAKATGADTDIYIDYIRVAIQTGAIQDFTAPNYTEVDASTRLTVTATKITAVDCDRDIDAYVYKDFGVDYFNALNTYFEVYQSSATLLYGDIANIGFSNTVNAVDAWESTSISAQWNRAASVPYYRFYLVRGAQAATDYYIAAQDTLYYCTMSRAAGNDAATIKVYSDAARTTLLDTLSVAGYGTAKWRYCYGFASWNDGTAGADWDGYTQNLDFNEVVATSSKFPVLSDNGIHSLIFGGQVVRR